MDFTPSPTYLYDSEQLNKELSEGTVTKEEHARILENLIETELLKPRGAVEDFIRQELRKHEKSRKEALKQEELKKLFFEQERIKNEKRVEEAKKIAEEKRQQQEEERLEEGKENRAYNYKIYANNVFRDIEKFKIYAKRYGWGYVTLQTIIIFSSIIATTAADSASISRLLVGLFSMLTAIAASVLSTFKIKEKSYSHRQAFSSMEIEYHKYYNRLDEYYIDGDAAFKIFSGKINEIKQQYADQELSFWQPSEKPTSKDIPQDKPPQQKTEDDKEEKPTGDDKATPMAQEEQT